MKNVSFMQLVLGVAGGLLIYGGIKNVNVVAFLGDIATDPRMAFNQGHSFGPSKLEQQNANKNGGQYPASESSPGVGAFAPSSTVTGMQPV